MSENVRHRSPHSLPETPIYDHNKPYGRGYLFAAIWADGSAEVLISHNGEAEHRYCLASNLTGPTRILHGDVPHNGKMSANAMLAYCAETLGIAPETFQVKILRGGTINFLREATVLALEPLASGHDQ